MQDEQQTQHPLTLRSEWRTLQNGSKIQSQNVHIHIYGYVFHDISDQNHGQTSNIAWTPTCRPLVGKTILRKFYWDQDGKKDRIGNVCLFFEHKDYSYLYVDAIKMAGRKQNLNPL